MNSNLITVNPLEFILGGNSSFTLVIEGCIPIKYRIKANDTNTCWFVSTEPTTEMVKVDLGGKPKKVVYQGYLKRDLSFNLGKKGSLNYNKCAIHYLTEYLLALKSDRHPRVEIYHHGTCSVCGRKLTDIDSLQCGIGPTCKKKMKGARRYA